MSEQSRKRWRAVALIACLSAGLVAAIMLVKPLRIQFHRTMMYASHDMYLRVRATSIPEMKSRWMMDHTHWHRDQLVRLGYLNRGTYRFHSLVVPSQEYSDLLSMLPFASGDYYWSISRDGIAVFAPRPELDRLMAIVESYDVAPPEAASKIEEPIGANQPSFE